MIEESKQGAVSVIALNDPLTADNVAEAAEVLQRCFHDGPPMAVFDMAKVPLVDSAGLELLLNAHDGFAERGGAFKLAAPTQLCVDILSVTGVAEQLEVHDELLMAVRSFLR